MAKSFIWTADMQKTAEQLREEGKTYTFISHKLGVGRSTIARHLNERERLYTIWYNLKRRCCDPSNRQYHRYGGRGIKIYKAWTEDYESFRRYIEDALGPRPTVKHSLDRIDNNGNYEPGNLRWADQLGQARNKEFIRAAKQRPYITITKRTNSTFRVRFDLTRTFRTEKQAEHCAKKLQEEFAGMFLQMDEFLERYRTQEDEGSYWKAENTTPLDPSRRRNKLTSHMVEDILVRANNGEPQTSIAKEYKVTPSHVSHIICNRSKNERCK